MSTCGHKVEYVHNCHAYQTGLSTVYTGAEILSYTAMLDNSRALNDVIAVRLLWMN
jgi:hypothetical protein